jgi:hypothetical protein
MSIVAQLPCITLWAPLAAFAATTADRRVGLCRSDTQEYTFRTTAQYEFDETLAGEHGSLNSEIGHAVGTGVLHIMVVVKTTRSGAAVCSRLCTHVPTRGQTSLLPCFTPRAVDLRRFLGLRPSMSPSRLRCGQDDWRVHTPVILAIL